MRLFPHGQVADGQVRGHLAQGAAASTLISEFHWRFVVKTKSALAFALLCLESVAVAFSGLAGFPFVLSKQAQKFFPPLHPFGKPVLKAWQFIVYPLDVVSVHKNKNLPKSSFCETRLERQEEGRKTDSRFTRPLQRR